MTGSGPSRDDTDTSRYSIGSPIDEMRSTLETGTVSIAVYGLGKMGLPLAAVYAERIGTVTGVDIDPSVVETVNNGAAHVTGEPGLHELVAEQVDAGRLRATSDGASAAAAASIHVCIVPTLLDDENEPDLTTVESVFDDIATGLSTGDLVVVESTVPPGTCRDVVRPHLVEQSGLSSTDFGVAFCPERTSSGTALRDIRGQYPKVVGGVDDDSTRAAAVLYERLSDNRVHVVSDATTAEAVKVFEGLYRDVNIALANELGRTADDLGISVREAIATANALPMCHIHDPGPGVGGHCIPVYPYFLFDRTDEPMPLATAARSVNDAMPSFVVSKLATVLEQEGIALSDATVLVLGFTYRAGVEETRLSPAVGILESLREHGSTIVGVDPLVDPTDFGVSSYALSAVPETSSQFDAAILVTAHDEFAALDWSSIDPLIVVDTRDTLSLEDTHHSVYTVGGSRRRPLIWNAADDSEDDRTTSDSPSNNDRTVGDTTDESSLHESYRNSSLSPQYRTDGGCSNATHGSQIDALNLSVIGLSAELGLYDHSSSTAEALSTTNFSEVLDLATERSDGLGLPTDASSIESNEFRSPWFDTGDRDGGG